MNVPLFSGNIVVFNKPVARFFQCHINRCELEIRQIAPQLRVVRCFLELAVRFRCVENQTVLRKRNDENWKHLANTLAQSNAPSNTHPHPGVMNCESNNKQESLYGQQRNLLGAWRLLDKMYRVFHNCWNKAIGHKSRILNDTTMMITFIERWKDFIICNCLSSNQK